MKNLKLLYTLFVLWFAIVIGATQMGLLPATVFLPIYLAVIGSFILIGHRLVSYFQKETLIGSVVFFFMLKPFIGALSTTNITLAELITVLVTVFLLQKIASAHIEIEGIIAQITLNLNGLSPRIIEGNLEEAYRELRRARRFNSQLSLAIVKPDYAKVAISNDTLSDHMQKEMVLRFAEVKMIRTIAENLRESDLLIKVRDELVITMPNTPIDTARMLVLTGDGDNVEVPFLAGFSTFPDEAVTFHSLLGNARAELEGVPLPFESVRKEEETAVFTSPAFTA